MPFKQIFGRYILLSFLLFGSSAHVAYATDTDRWRAVGDNTDAIDHSAWQGILDRYLLIQKDDPAHAPLTLFRYRDVSSGDRTALQAYLAAMQEIDPRDYGKTEQFAYWVNLYNALTVELILDNYPVKSITKLGPLLSFGPWNEDAATIAGEVLSLNDIEHKILRPIWRDPRIHYAVNCASFSCPNLSPRAFTRANTEILLDQAARDYLDHPRGMAFEGDRLRLSKIFKWYDEDFGGSEAGVIAHIKQYVDPETKARLENFDGRVRYRYDWSLNEPE